MVIKIKYMDFWEGFNSEENFLSKVLQKRFHVELSNNPDYVIYSCFGCEHLKYNHCIKIFYTGENLVPDFNLCDYAIGFHYIQLEDRYFRFPLYKLYDTFNLALQKHNRVHTTKRKFCNFVYSNNKANPIRQAFFHELNNYKKVDSGGRYLNNTGSIIKNKIDFQSDYKFSIAFENSQCNGYTTEKLIDAFAAGTIPIYWGNPVVHRDVNQKSFIDYYQFGSIQNIIDKIIEIDKNDELYLNMLAEPMILDANRIDVENDQFIRFLFNIFEQSKKDAYRRSFYGYELEYFERMKLLSNRMIYRKVMSKMRSVFSLDT